MGTISGWVYQWGHNTCDSVSTVPSVVHVMLVVKRPGRPGADKAGSDSDDAEAPPFWDLWEENSALIVEAARPPSMACLKPADPGLSPIHRFI